MKGQYLIFSTLLLLTLPTNIFNQNPSNHLVALLQGSNQQLQALAALGASQKAFTTVTTIVNNILAAMQQMSLPYYQNQLNLIQNQQTSLMNRLSVLQAQVSANTTMLLKSTNAVSSALNAQVSNIGGRVFAYENSINQELNSLFSQINTINTQNNPYVNEFTAFVANQTTLQPLVAQLTQQSNSELYQLGESFFGGNLTYPYFSSLNNNNPTTSIPYCVSQTFNLIHYGNNPSVFTVNIVATENQGTTNAYDLYEQSFVNSVLTLYICDRSRSTFTYIPSILSFEVNWFESYSPTP